jgi:hypothetical protein
MGRGRTPLVESDPQPKHIGPNYYYNQEDVLMEFRNEHSETDWNIVMPAAVIGTTNHASMNTALSWGVYAAVQVHKKEHLRFSGDMVAWQFGYTHWTARLTSYLSEWAVFEEGCKNQRFNAQDGGLFSYDRFYNELARWFAVDTVLGPEEDESKYEVAATFAGSKNCPLGYGPPMPLELAHSFEKWAGEPPAAQAWEEMMKQSKGHLKTNVFEDKDTFFMADFSLIPFGTLSMKKPKRFGFNGFVDTVESIFKVYQKMAKISMLPPMKVDSARPLV